MAVEDVKTTRGAESVSGLDSVETEIAAKLAADCAKIRSPCGWLAALELE